MKRALAGAFLAIGLSGAVTANVDAAECFVKAHSVARIGAPEKGILRTIPYDRGDTVRKGDVLAELESSRERDNIEVARLRAENDIAVRMARKRAEVAELKVERQERLRKRDFASEADLEEAILEAETARLEEQQAEFELRLAGVDLETALAALERRFVRSPFDGVITERMMSEGELYNEQEPILTLARIDPLDVETFLPAVELARVSPGKIVPVELETGGTVNATISVVDPFLDGATGTFGVRLTLDNPEGEILAGQRCQLKFADAGGQ